MSSTPNKSLGKVARSGSYSRIEPCIDQSIDVDRTEAAARTWSPYTLRRPFLVFLASICVVLSIVLVVLSWYSATYYGLGKDDGSLSLLVGWRYTPTLVAVLSPKLL
jgi:hypothetical protein